jgi:hypothetical protein
LYRNVVQQSDVRGRSMAREHARYPAHATHAEKPYHDWSAEELTQEIDRYVLAATAYPRSNLFNGL